MLRYQTSSQQYKTQMTLGHISSSGFTRPKDPASEEEYMSTRQHTCYGAGPPPPPNPLPQKAKTQAVIKTLFDDSLTLWVVAIDPGLLQPCREHSCLGCLVLSTGLGSSPIVSSALSFLRAVGRGGSSRCCISNDRVQRVLSPKTLFFIGSGAPLIQKS